MWIMIFMGAGKRRLKPIISTRLCFFLEGQIEFKDRSNSAVGFITSLSFFVSLFLPFSPCCSTKSASPSQCPIFPFLFFYNLLPSSLTLHPTTLSIVFPLSSCYLSPFFCSHFSLSLILCFLHEIQLTFTNPLSSPSPLDYSHHSYVFTPSISPCLFV